MMSKPDSTFVPPPARLALCITELATGGAERCLLELARRLDPTRFKPVVYSLAPAPSRAERSLIPALEQAGVQVHCLGARGRGSAISCVMRLRALLRAQRAQVVQSFLFHANLVARLAARGARVPHVVSGIRVAERRDNWHLRLDRWTSRWVSHYVCVSQSVLDFSRAVGRLPNERLMVIPNGIDVAAWERAPSLDLGQFGVPPGRRIVTFVGRLDAQKNLAWLLKDCHAWFERLPLHDLLIVGEGRERAALERLANEQGISQRVHFAGWREDVARILNSSQLLVLPSRWEGMPNVVLEAMACGIPVVCTEVEGVRELLGPGADGQVVAQGDAAAMVDRLTHFASNASIAGAAGAANRQRVSQEFSLDAMVRRYQDLYERLLGRSA